MLLRVNGLYGWVRVNDRRSIVLFAGFLAALNVAAVLGLYLPLLAFDADHAPVLAWGGYAQRYVPLVTLAAIGVFALQMLWHVKSVQRAMAFTFVDNADESRLCGLLEPLAISMGLPAPYVGVIEARALNAFACGLNRKNAVVVVTRGLIDALDDDELSAVLAHELAHIANGDIRLLAAANACLRMIGWLVRPRLKESSRLRELVAFPIIMAVMPPLFLFALIINFCAQSALRGSHLIRLLITSSREFIADAAAVEATQNPAALLSALRRIEGRSQLADLPLGQDAMMIDGACEGAFAMHPTIPRRIEAIIAVTGSMALIAPPRRDTRPTAAHPAHTSRIRTSVFGTQSSNEPRSGSGLRRTGAGDDRNWLGLTRPMSVGAVLAVVVFVGLHCHDLDQPAVLMNALDPRPASSFFSVAMRGSACNFAALGSLVLGPSKLAGCDGTALHDFTVAQAQVSGPVGALLTSMTQAPNGLYVHADGHFSNRPPLTVEAAEVREKRCFNTRSYARGDRGMHSLDERPRPDGSFDIRRWLAHTEALAQMAGEARSEDKLLRDYVTARKTNYETIDRFFGEPGLALARQALASAAHEGAIARLRERIQDPRWIASLTPVEAAEADLLTTSPDEFITCVARRRMSDVRP